MGSELLLLETLNCLDEEEVKTFRFHLLVAGNHNSFSSIPTAKLLKADRMDIATQMVKKYNKTAVDVALSILGVMDEHKLKEELEKKSLL